MGRVAKIQIRLKVRLSLGIENQSMLSRSERNAGQYVGLGLCGGYRGGKEDDSGKV